MAHISLLLEERLQQPKVGTASFLPKILRQVEKEFYHTSNTNSLIHQEINTSTNKEKMDSGGDESPANGVGSNGFNGLSFDVECIWAVEMYYIS